MEGAHVIDVNDLINYMTSKQAHGCPGVINKKNDEFPLIQTITRVPRNANEDVYETTVVSFGPYHHKTDATTEIKRRKWESFRYILQLNPGKKIRDYLEAMAGLEQQIRSCYADEIKFGTDELMKMMLLDGCFLLYILHGIEGASETIPRFKMANLDDETTRLEQSVKEAGVSSIEAGANQQTAGENSEHDDSIDNTYHTEQWNASIHIHDLVLLENQIPFFVMVKIFDLVTNGNKPVTALLENISMSMEYVLQPYPKAVLNFNQTKEVHHLLHLCHLFFKPDPIQMNRNSDLGTSHDDKVQSVIAGEQLHGWRRAIEYYNAGVEFRKREICSENPHSLLDIVFCDGVVEIPCLTIDPNTNCLFQNLIAFEETCPQFGNYIGAYVVFLSQFITTPDDVSLLTKRGIIVDQLDGDAEVSDLFRMLAQDVTFDFNSDYYLKHIFHVMEMHYQIGRPRWREWLGWSINSKFLSQAHESKSPRSPTRTSPGHLSMNYP